MLLDRKKWSCSNCTKDNTEDCNHCIEVIEGKTFYYNWCGKDCEDCVWKIDTYGVVSCSKGQQLLTDDDEDCKYYKLK